MPCLHLLLSSEGTLQAGLAHPVLAHQHEASTKHRLRPMGTGLVICSHCFQTTSQNLPRGIIWKCCPHSTCYFHNASSPGLSIMLCFFFFPFFFFPFPTQTVLVWRDLPSFNHSQTQLVINIMHVE